MEFQTLKKNNKKKWIIGSIIAITLIITITFIGTRAKFKTTNSIPIAKGIIKYNYDLDIVAVNIKNDNGEYVSSTELPTNGYTLNKEKSFCKVGSEKVNVSMEYKGKVYISTNKKGTKCELYFDKGEFKTKDLILSHNNIDTSRMSGKFTEPYSENTAGRIFNSIDDDGETYFFAGSNPNNWVKFGTNKEGQDLYWRIIRINGDESIRIIYNGPTTDQTGETTQIGTSAFNENANDNAYVGYMYGTPGSNTYEETHANINSSTIKGYIDTWYEENLKTNYEQYISLNTGFCGDRSYYSEVSQLSYGANIRAFRTINPIYKCLNSDNDLYTISASTKGNKALINPVGLITVDEVMYAGAFKVEPNVNLWIRNNTFFWTMSPAYFDGHYTRANSISNDGRFSNNATHTIYGVRPVINLKPTVLTTGKGTADDPYRIV